MDEQRIATIRTHAERGDLMQADSGEMLQLCDLAAWALKIKAQTVQRVNRSRQRRRRSRQQEMARGAAVGGAVASNRSLGQMQEELARLEKAGKRAGK